MTAKLLQTAMSRATALPEAAQEQIGQELVGYIDALEALRADVQAGITQLDAGRSEDLDMDAVIASARREHAGR